MCILIRLGIMTKGKTMSWKKLGEDAVWGLAIAGILYSITFTLEHQVAHWVGWAFLWLVTAVVIADVGRSLVKLRRKQPVK